MDIEIDNNEFCIRMNQDVAYFKAMGHHGKKEAAFFDSAVDKVLNEFSHEQFASLCNLKGLILSEPSIALDINNSISKIAESLDYKCNAIVISPKFLDIFKAFVFSFYLKNIQVKTKIFYREIEAINWIESFGFDVSKIRDFVGEE